MDRGAWWALVPVVTESDTTERFTFWAFQVALVVKKPLASPGDLGD